MCVYVCVCVCLSVPEGGFYSGLFSVWNGTLECTKVKVETRDTDRKRDRQIQRGRADKYSSVIANARISEWPGSRAKEIVMGTGNI